jgi:periplasmic divalent cation tolerance protein
MDPTRTHRMVMVTVPDLAVGRTIAGAVLESGTAACVNIVPGLESHYRWQGRLECSQELLLILKTTTVQLDALEQVVRAHHPYDTPEFIVIPIEGGSRRYLDWIDANVGGAGQGSGVGAP